MLPASRNQHLVKKKKSFQARTKRILLTGLYRICKFLGAFMCLISLLPAKDDEVNSSSCRGANTAHPLIEMRFICSAREFNSLWNHLIFPTCPMTRSEEITLNKAILWWCVIFWQTERVTATCPTPPSSLQSRVPSGMTGYPPCSLIKPRCGGGGVGGAVGGVSRTESALQWWVDLYYEGLMEGSRGVLLC